MFVRQVVTATYKSSVIRQKGESQNGCFKKDKARQNFRKTNISYPLTRTRTCAYQGVRNVCFSEILVCFAFLKHPFCDLPFCLIPDEVRFLEIIIVLPGNSFFYDVFPGQ